MSTVNVTVIANGISYTVDVAASVTPRQIISAFQAANPTILPGQGLCWQLTTGGVVPPPNVAIAVTETSSFTLTAVQMQTNSLLWLLAFVVVAWLLLK